MLMCMCIFFPRHSDIVNITFMVLTLFKRLLFDLTTKHSRKMSVFTQKLNPITGVNDWVAQSEDYDYHQEVARASFADMLHDTERNQMYEMGLKLAIEKMHTRGKQAHVLDIGTGTGLLSMMAVRNGADSVTACEAFKPMGECALKIMELNGFKDKIRVIPKRSTDLTVGENGDLYNKCNILVTEVFDTELIGEGALSTFKHAHDVLLEKDCIVVPQSATIFAQVVECPLAQNWNKLNDYFNEDGELLIKIPESVKNCAGSAAVHDIQLSQLPSNFINTIISPIPVLRFDWSGKTPFIFDRSTINNAKAERDGKAQAVFMWWDLEMDTENKIILSCAPYWAHYLTVNNPQVSIPWRDHWMQAVYYFPKEVDVKKGQELNLISCHDEYSLWFNLKTNLKITDMHYLNPLCECGLHITFARTRIGQINDSKRNKKYISLMEKYVNKDSVILVISDGFYVSLVAAKMGAKKVYYIETNCLSRRVLLDFVKFNNLKNVDVIDNVDSLKNIDLKQINMVFGEPYFTSSILPWDNLLFTYIFKGIKQFLSENVKIFPQRAVIKAIAVNFFDLYKIRSPLGICEGFNMEPFDKLIEESCSVSDDNVEAQPLWEYPGTALSNEVIVADIDLINFPENQFESNGVFQIQGSRPCNGVALWIDWVLDGTPKGTITTGPIVNTEIDQKIHWDMYTRQGVCLFPNKNEKEMNYNFKFDFNDGNISFTCK